MDKDRELLKQAAERLARHGHNIKDLLLGDKIYKHLHEVKRPTIPDREPYDVVSK